VGRYLSLERVGEWMKEMRTSLWDFKSSLACRKILRHGTSGFTSHPRESVLRNFIALKNQSPWLGSNPQPLGPVTTTLTTTPPRRHSSVVVSSCDLPVGDRELLYCVAQQCQINSLRFHSYGSCLFSSV
jgi:hypothetical protein